MMPVQFQIFRPQVLVVIWILKFLFTLYAILQHIPCSCERSIDFDQSETGDQASPPWEVLVCTDQRPAMTVTVDAYIAPNDRETHECLWRCWKGMGREETPTAAYLCGFLGEKHGTRSLQSAKRWPFPFTASTLGAGLVKLDWKHSSVQYTVQRDEIYTKVHPSSCQRLC